jgi:hypothetical protein
MLPVKSWPQAISSIPIEQLSCQIQGGFLQTALSKVTGGIRLSHKEMGINSLAIDDR